MDATSNSLLQFWRDIGSERRFRKDEALDAEIRERFLDLHREAAGMRSTLMTIAYECAALFERVIDLVPEWKALPKGKAEPWSRLGVR